MGDEWGECESYGEQGCERGEEGERYCPESTASLNLLAINHSVSVCVCACVSVRVRWRVSAAQLRDERGFKHHPDDSLGGGACNCCSLFVFLRGL